MVTQDESRLTETVIAGTLYIVESVTSKSASESVESKVKRLILNNLNTLQTSAKGAV